MMKATIAQAINFIFLVIIYNLI